MSSQEPEGTAKSSFQSIKPVRAYEGVVSQVEEAIFKGQLVPGERLPSERDMMAQFAVSRSTIREALRVLESDGLVRSRPGDPHGGAEVQPRSSQRVSKSLKSFARLGQLGIVELVQFRMVVEGSAIRLAAVMHTDDDLKKILAAFELMKSTVDGPYGDYSDADVAFHLAVSECSGNQLLSACSDFATDMVLSLISDKLQGSPDRVALMHDTLRRHGAYLEAIESRNGAEAETLARRDLVEYYSPYVEKSERERLTLLL